jgi:hypothetical protein
LSWLAVSSCPFLPPSCAWTCSWINWSIKFENKLNNVSN